MKQRKVADQMLRYLKNPDRRLVFLWGPRQVGKSTILRFLHKTFHGVFLNFEDLEDQRLFVPEGSTLSSLLRFRTNDAKSRFVFIDEVQNHPDSTKTLKLLVDTTDRIIVATGSSELRAKTKTFDALTGRFIEFFLYPLTIDEYAHFIDESERLTDTADAAVKQHLLSYLEPFLIYGGYPHVALIDDKIDALKTIARISIVKDVVDIYNLKNTTLVYDLLRMLAFQIGNLVNVSELTSALHSTKPTIMNYLDILVKNHVIRFLEPYRTNARRAIVERKKVYFIDLGVRNALIDDFRPIHLRPDAGAVFENAVVMGNIRQSLYRRRHEAHFFYREHAGGEIDLVIKSPRGGLSAHEIKWGKGSVTKPKYGPVVSVHRIGRAESITYLL